MHPRLLVVACLAFVHSGRRLQPTRQRDSVAESRETSRHTDAACSLSVFPGEHSLWEGCFAVKRADGPLRSLATLLLPSGGVAFSLPRPGAEPLIHHPAWRHRQNPCAVRITPILQAADSNDKHQSTSEPAIGRDVPTSLHSIGEKTSIFWPNSDPKPSREDENEISKTLIVPGEYECTRNLAKDRKAAIARAAKRLGFTNSQALSFRSHLLIKKRCMAGKRTKELAENLHACYKAGESFVDLAERHDLDCKEVALQVMIVEHGSKEKAKKVLKSLAAEAKRKRKASSSSSSEDMETASLARMRPTSRLMFFVLSRLLLPILKRFPIIGLSLNDYIRNISGYNASARDQAEVFAVQRRSSDFGAEKFIRAQSDKFEASIGDFLSRLGISFETEETMKKRKGAQFASPDFLICSPCVEINGKQVRWIEAKRYYGEATPTPVSVTAKHCDQIQRYTKRFGPGAVIFQHGFSRDLLQELPKSMQPDVFFLDSTPLKTKSKISSKSTSAKKQSRKMEKVVVVYTAKVPSVEGKLSKAEKNQKGRTTSKSTSAKKKQTRKMKEVVVVYTAKVPPVEGKPSKAKESFQDQVDFRKQLLQFVQSKGGTLHATRMDEFYSNHPELRQHKPKKLKVFVQKNVPELCWRSPDLIVIPKFKRGR